MFYVLVAHPSCHCFFHWICMSFGAASWVEKGVHVQNLENSLTLWGKANRMRALGKIVPIDVKFRCFGRTMVLGVSWEGLRGSCEGMEFDSIVKTTLNISSSVALKLVCHANFLVSGLWIIDDAWQPSVLDFNQLVQDIRVRIPIHKIVCCWSLLWLRYGLFYHLDQLFLWSYSTL